jgi:hypothetical protein
LAFGPTARFFSHHETTQFRAQAGQRLEAAGGESQPVLDGRRSPAGLEERLTVLMAMLLLQRKGGACRLARRESVGRVR